MKEYIEKIYTKLHEAMEKPVTLGSAEEVGMYAKTIRRLEKLDFRADEPDAAAFDRETAIHWAEMSTASRSRTPRKGRLPTSPFRAGWAPLPSVTT